MDKKNETQEVSSSNEKTLSSEKLEAIQNEAQQELTNKPLMKEDSTQPLQENDTSNSKEDSTPYQDQTTSPMDEPLFATVDGEKVEETILDSDETEDDPSQELLHGVEEAIKEEEVTALEAQLEGIDDTIRSLMSKYKLTMYILVASIVVYLLFLFVFRPTWATYVVIATCIIMLVLAVVNTRISKKIQQLAVTRKTVRQSLEKLKTNGEDEKEPSVEEIKEEAIVANATSMNDLPKQYTVLDDVQFQDGKIAPHVVVSPYGIAVVGDPNLKDEIQADLDILEISSPIFFYDPTTDVATLVENIQMEKQIVLNEEQIYTLLKEFVGL